VRHLALQNSIDALVTTSTIDPSAGTFRVPGRTAALFVVMSRVMVPTSAIVLSATPTPVVADTTWTGLVVAIIWTVIAIVLAVTAFLIWRTRPRR
jgi:hypothetical protein